MNKKLYYNTIGRGGTVTYEDEHSNIQFDFEFGGGNCVAIIFIPSPEHWESQTKRIVAERNSILDFVAQKATLDQVSNGHYKISDNYIEIFSKK